MTSLMTFDPRRFGTAVALATEWHAPQTRKGSGIPYLAHLLGVSSLVLEFGGNEDEAIAGLLHDALEDGPSNTGRSALDLGGEIEETFGEEVARLVWACTDDAPEADGRKAPWAERKTTYLASLASKDASALLVSCADKLYNARSVLKDFREFGDGVFERFTAGRAGTLWYYDRLAAAYEARLKDESVEARPGLVALVRELRRTVNTLLEGAKFTPDERAVFGG